MSPEGSCESRIRAQLGLWPQLWGQAEALAAIAAEYDREIARLTAALRGEEPPDVAVIAEEERSHMRALDDDYDAERELDGDEGGAV